MPFCDITNWSATVGSQSGTGKKKNFTQQIFKHRAKWTAALINCNNPSLLRPAPCRRGGRSMHLKIKAQKPDVQNKSVKHNILLGKITCHADITERTNLTNSRTTSQPLVLTCTFTAPGLSPGQTVVYKHLGLSKSCWVYSTDWICLSSPDTMLSQSFSQISTYFQPHWQRVVVDFVIRSKATIW